MLDNKDNKTSRQKGCSIELFRANQLFEDVCSVTAHVTDLDKWEEYFRLSDDIDKHRNVGKVISSISMKRKNGEPSYLITSRLLIEQFELYANNKDDYPEVLVIKSAQRMKLLNSKKDVSISPTISP